MLLSLSCTCTARQPPLVPISLLLVHARAPSPTVLFLAIKVEASPFGEVNDLSKAMREALNKSDAEVVAHETLLLQGNRFTLTMHHVYRALRVMDHAPLPTPFPFPSHH